MFFNQARKLGDKQHYTGVSKLSWSISLLLEKTESSQSRSFLRNFKRLSVKVKYCGMHKKNRHRVWGNVMVVERFQADLSLQSTCDWQH